MSLQKIDATNFDEKIKDKDKLVIIDFYADWCGPCKMLSPILEEIAKENSDLVIYKVNTDDATELAIKHKISNLPTLVSFKDGVEHKRVTGAMPKDMLLASIR